MVGVGPVAIRVSKIRYRYQRQHERVWSDGSLFGREYITQGLEPRREYILLPNRVNILNLSGYRNILNRLRSFNAFQITISYIFFDLMVKGANELFYDTLAHYHGRPARELFTSSKNYWVMKL